MTIEEARLLQKGDQLLHRGWREGLTVIDPKIVPSRELGGVGEPSVLARPNQRGEYTFYAWVRLITSLTPLLPESIRYPEGV